MEHEGKFELGRVGMTRNVAESLIDHDSIEDMVVRHHNGEWGEYYIRTKFKHGQDTIYIITEQDDQEVCTTVMFENEY